MAYVLLVDRLERHVLAERQVAAAYLAAGGEGTMPDPQEQRELFDAALVEEPKASTLDPDQVELRRALGVL